MIDEYLKVAAINQQREALLAKMQEPTAPSPDNQQGAGAMGSDVSTDQPAVEPTRVQPFAAKYASLELAVGMGQELARLDFQKRAARAQFEKAALSLAPIANFAMKNPAMVGAGVGAVGGALAGGPDHRLSGALGGAALGAGAGSAGVGIGSRMARGQNFTTAAGNYGTNMKRRFNVAAEKAQRWMGAEKAPAKAAPAAAASTAPAQKAPLQLAAPAAPTPAPAQPSPQAPTPQPARTTVTPSPAAPALAAGAVQPPPAAGRVVPAAEAAQPQLDDAMAKARAAVRNRRVNPEAISDRMMQSAPTAAPMHGPVPDTRDLDQKLEEARRAVRSRRVDPAQIKEVGQRNQQILQQRNDMAERRRQLQEKRDYINILGTPAR